MSIVNSIETVREWLDSTVCPMVQLTYTASPYPTARAMAMDVPMESPTRTTVTICMIWLPTATAVMLAGPSNWPMITRSAIP